ncbi:MAG: hypothetical protein Q9227_007013 [Pyrenula ochraceoflavens]
MRDRMPRPIVGIGHSFGANHLVNLAYIHPRLLSTLVLMDPVMYEYSSTPPKWGRNSPAVLSTYRRDIWPSRTAAAESFAGSKFYQRWDKRVLEHWVQHGLRDLPTLLYPGIQEGEDGPQVTLATTKHQEVFTFLRPNYDERQKHGGIASRQTHPDLDTTLKDIWPFYRAESINTFSRLPELRPSVLYAFGEKSEMSEARLREAKLGATGVGVGGSGGVREGRVKEIIIEKAGHLVAMEEVTQCADAAATWLGSEIQRINAEDERFYAEWDKKTLQEKSTIDQKWKQMMGPPPERRKAGHGSKI